MARAVEVPPPTTMTLEAMRRLVLQLNSQIRALQEQIDVLKRAATTTALILLLAHVAVAQTDTPANTSTPAPCATFRLKLPNPDTNPPSQSWGKNVISKLNSETFASACGGGGTAVPVATETPSPTGVATSTITVTATPTYTATATPTATPTETPVATGTATATWTPYAAWSIFVPSSGETIVADVPGDTATFTCLAPLVCTGTASTDTIVWSIQTYTPSGTYTPTATFTQTPTWTPTATWTQTATWTPTRTWTPTSTPTAADTATPTRTFTATPTSTATWTPLSIFCTGHPSSGSDIVADSQCDTFNATGTSPIVVTGTAATDTLVWSWDFSVANTWTGLQTFDAGILLKVNDTAAFGDSSESTIKYDGTNLVVSPKVSGSGRLTVNGGISAWADGTTVASGTTIAFVDAAASFTLNALSIPQVRGFQYAPVVTVEDDPSAFAETTSFRIAPSFKNPSGEVRSYANLSSSALRDSTVFTADTQTGQTAPTHVSFNMTPTFNVASGGTFTAGGTFLGSNFSPTCGAGATCAELTALKILDKTGAGTVTLNRGLSIATLTGTTNHSMEVGSSQSWIVGAIEFGAANVPTSGTQVEVTQATLGNEVLRLQSTATNDDPQMSVKQQRGTTSGAASVNFDFPTVTDYVDVVEFNVTARCVSGAGCTAGQAGGWASRALYRNVAGTLTKVNETNSYAQDDITGTIVTPTTAVSGTNIRLTCTGLASQTLVWHVNWLTHGHVST